MVKFLGVIDLVAVALLFAPYYRIEIPQGLLIGVAAVLIIKGLVFIKDIVSMADIAAGVLLLIALFASLPILVILPVAIFVGFKGIMSLFAV